MEDQIPQSFKVQWINTTLKYLKNDNQLVMEYPEMPVQHMQYLHNLIWQRRNNVGLGFKSMYAPVWEAMKIFSLKYQFKVFVNKSVDGQKGHLVIEKIPKNGQDNTEQVKQENQEPAKVNNSELAEQEEGYQSTDSEDSSQSQPNSPRQNPTMSQLKKTRPKKKKKSQKFVIDKQKIIESISPVLLRKALQKILDFLLKQEEASIIFSDLAPVEAKFLENFLGIYNKRQSFQSILSPACNELLDRMCEFFKEFDKQCKLEVYAAKYNVNTKKREVTFMKVPRYTRTNAKLSQSNFIAPQMKVENIQSVSPFRNSKEKRQKPISSQTIVNSNLRITLTNENTTKYDTIEKREVKLSMNSENREAKLSMVEGNRENKSSLHNSVVNTTNTDYLNHRENGEVKPNKNNTHYDATDKMCDKEVKLSMNAGTKDNKLSETVETTNMREKQKGSENKEGLKQEIEQIDHSTDATKRILPETKIETPTVSNNKLRDVYLGPRKEKLLTAMSTPLESDKAIRMMRLMGWRGGALGPRGHGIVEPLIPALDIVPGKGLGHVPEKPKSTKPVKPVKEPPVKESSKPNEAVKISKSARVEHRTAFLKGIVELLDKDSSEHIITYPTKLVGKEQKCYEAIIQSLNEGLGLTLTKSEVPVLITIQRIMAEKPDLSLEMVFAADFRELKITKLSRKQTLLTEIAVPRKTPKEDLKIDCQMSKQTRLTEMTVPRKNPKEDLKIDCQMSKKDFRLYICLAVLEFLESGDTEKSIDFDGVLRENYLKVAETMCTYINRRAKIPFLYLKELYTKILDNTKECFLEVKMKMTRSLLLRKIQYRKPYVNNEVLKNIINKYTSAKIPDTHNQIDNVNANKDEETIKTNSSYFKETNKENTDTVSNSVVDNEIKENTHKADECNDLDYNLKVNDNITVDNSNEIRGNKLKENLIRFPLYVKNMYTADNDDFRRIDRDLLQDTINLLTLHDKKSEENKVKLHNSEIITNNHECNHFNVNDNSKYNESSKQSDELDMPCEIAKNIRKWYAHSEKFLICDDLVKSSSVKSVDSNNNRNQITLVKLSEDLGEKITTTETAENKDCKINDDTESDIPNQNDKSYSKLEQKDQDLKLITEYEGCDGIKDGMDEVKLNESHQSVEKHLECYIIQKEANSGDLLIPIPAADDKNSLVVADSEKSYHEVTKCEIQIDSDSITKQGSEVDNDIKDMIDLSTSNQTEKQSESDLIPVGENRGEDLNAISVNGVRTNSIKDSADMIELKKKDQVNEKHSELDLIQLETHNEKVLNDYGSDESNPLYCDVIREKNHNEENSKDYEGEYSYKCTKTDEINSKLDIISEELDNKGELTLRPKGSHQTDDNNSELNAKQIEANNTKGLTLTNEFEIDEQNKSPEESEIHSKLEITKVKTDCDTNMSRKRKYHIGPLEQCYELFEAKHMFDKDEVNDGNVENIKHRNKHRKEGLEEFNETDKINSKLDTIQEETDHEEKSISISEPGKEIPKEFHRKEVNSQLDIIQVGIELKEKSTLTNEFETENLEESHSKEGNSKSDVIKDGTSYKDNFTNNESVFQEKNPENSHKHEDINSKLHVFQFGTDYKENSTITNELEVESFNPNLEEFKVKSDYINDDSRHVNENQTKELSNVRKEIVKNCHDIVLIRSDILEIEAIQKKIQSIIENMASDNVQVFRPLLKHHGVLDNGIVYSCHSEETCLWLKNALADHDVIEFIDYRSAIDNHKLKIKVTSSNKDAKKLLELLQVYNHGLKCHDWKIIYENHYYSSLIIGVEMDNTSFEYICDSNFSLCVGYDFAQFSIAY